MPDNRLIGSRGEPLPVTGPYRVLAVHALPPEAAQDALNALHVDGYDLEVRGPLDLPAVSQAPGGGQHEVKIPALYVIAKKRLTTNGSAG